MRLKIINPAVGIADDLVEGWKSYLSRFLHPGTVIEFESVTHGFPSVETETQGIINGSEVLRLVKKTQSEDYQGIFINCFDDPGVIAAREFSKIPVLGPYEASVLFASLLAEKVAVISTDQYGVACEERKRHLHRMENRIQMIVNADMTVLELVDTDKALRILYQRCEELAKKHVGAAVLGCTGMCPVVDALNEKLLKNGIGIQVVEPLKTGVTMLEYMVRSRHTNTFKSTEIGDFPV